jgi:MFS family permease
MSTKPLMPPILTRAGYRTVLLANTAILGLLIAGFATIGPATPVWVIVLQAFGFGFFSSMQYTSMNTLTYADIAPREVSMASTIASTVQQMSLSFGVAVAALVTALFLPAQLHASPPQMIHGIHQAFLLLGGLTILSASVFRELRSTDGETVSQHHQTVAPVTRPSLKY